MDKETYKVAVNLLARYGDKINKPSLASSPTTPSKPFLNRSLPSANLTQRTTQMTLPITPQPRTTGASVATPRLHLNSQMSSISSTLISSSNQQLRRRTPFPIVNYQDKGVFDRIVDVLIGDGPQDRFAMICKECSAHNGMALQDDFYYTTYTCAFCNALNPARKTRPVAPRLSVLPPPPAISVDSDTSDSDDDKEDSDGESIVNSNDDATQFSAPIEMNNSEVDNGPSTSFSNSPKAEEKNAETSFSSQSEKLNEESIEASQEEADASFDELVKQLEKSAIKDATLSPE